MIMHKEFEKTELGWIPSDWKVELLDKVAERKSGHTPNKKKDSYWNGEIPWISLKDLSRLNNRFVYETTDYTTIEGINNSSAVLLPKGTIVISRDASVGKVGITSKEMATSQHFINYICGENLDNIYLYYYLLFNDHVFKQIATGSTIKTIGLDFFKKFKIALPPIEEQKQIGSILTIWDNAIELKEKLIAQKKEQKKGLMQQLISGNIRVPGFSSEWSIKNVGELIMESKEVAKHPKISERITVRLSLKGVTKRETTTIEKEGATTQYVRSAGQFIYGKQNLHKGAIGLVPKELDGFQSSTDLPAFDFKDGIEPLWFYYYFARESFYESLEDIATGTGSKRIQPKELYKLKIKVPLIDEQKKQVKIFQSMDQAINLLQKELELLILQKKALMQQLLTGKIRVKV